MIEEHGYAEHFFLTAPHICFNIYLVILNDWESNTLTRTGIEKAVVSIDAGNAEGSK